MGSSSTDPATTTTCRLRLVRLAGAEVETVVDLHRVTHEAPPAEWFEALEDVDVEPGESWFTVELWLESAAARWLRDSRIVTREIADALVEGHLDRLLDEPASLA